jgi:hypothetical protein
MLAEDGVKRSLLRFAHSRVTFHMSIFSGYPLLAVALTYPIAFDLTTHIPIALQIPGWAPGDSDPWHPLRSYAFHVPHTYLPPASTCSASSTAMRLLPRTWCLGAQILDHLRSPEISSSFFQSDCPRPPPGRRHRKRTIISYQQGKRCCIKDPVLTLGKHCDFDERSSRDQTPCRT